MNRNLLLLSLLLTVVFSACQGQTQEQQEPYADLDVEAFKAKMAGDDVVVLDVRTPGETAQGMIEGAIEIDVNAPDFTQKIAELDQDKTYLVYCRSGRRSVTACNAMSEAGFEHLYNLLGGYQAWTAGGGD